MLLSPVPADCHNRADGLGGVSGEPLAAAAALCTATAWLLASGTPTVRLAAQDVHALCCPPDCRRRPSCLVWASSWCVAPFGTPCFSLPLVQPHPPAAAAAAAAVPPCRRCCLLDTPSVSPEFNPGHLCSASSCPQVIIQLAVRLACSNIAGGWLWLWLWLAGVQLQEPADEVACLGSPTDLK